jgi:hypothetical protein
MRNNPDDLSNQTIAKIKKHCEDEIEINQEHHWSTIVDGTGDICRGRLEFAEGLLDQIKKWEKVND